MANLAPVYLYNKGFRNNEQWNEKFEKPSIDSPGRLPMSNILPLAPENDGFLSKPPQNNNSIKSSSFNGKKCQVYVHHFSKIPSKSSNNYIENNWRSGSEVHQNMYKHEFSTLKKQFDNLSLQSSQKPQTSSPFKFTKGYSKPQTQERHSYLSRASYAKSVVNGKIDKSILFKPEHKAIVDKLEESYWAKWKPNKNATNKEPHPKTKGLYTENEKIKIHYQNTNKNGTKERGDSNNSIISPEKDETPADNNLIYINNSDPKDIQEEEEIEEVEKEIQEEEEKIEISDNEENKPVENTKGLIMLSESSCELAHKSEVECGAVSLKHTDSFILTSKKHTQEKSPYQQPKCIKLFKNAGYTTTAQTNYIKSGTRGGSYPLKSCLKKETPQKSNLLGRPGSPIKVGNFRRPGKANQFIK